MKSQWKPRLFRGRGNLGPWDECELPCPARDRGRGASVVAFRHGKTKRLHPQGAGRHHGAVRSENEQSNPVLTLPRATLLASVTLLAGLVSLAAASCGARSDLLDVGGVDDGAGAGTGAGSNTGGNGGAGASGGAGAGGAAACVALGSSCHESDLPCCEGVCAKDVCEIPPPACASDAGPVVLVTGLSDPYAMGGDATSLFVGQLHPGKPLLRIPKAGGSAVSLVESVNYVEYIVIQEDTVFYSTEDSLNTVATAGGPATKLVGAFGPAGLSVTKDRIFLAEYFGQQLVAIDRTTQKKEVLQDGMSGIYRVAVTQGDVFFSTFFEGVYVHDLSTGGLSVVGEELGDPRAVLGYHDDLYFTVPSTQRIHRLAAGASTPTLVADLSGLGVFIEALVTDGQHLYTTVLTGNGTGVVARVPLGGGAPEVITDQAGSSPSALVVDEYCVYWTERNGGTVYRAQKSPAPQP